MEHLFAMKLLLLAQKNNLKNVSRIWAYRNSINSSSLVGVKIELRQISTSLANCRNDPAQIAGPNMMTKMLRRQKYIFDQCKKDQAQKQNRRQKPSKLTFEDNSKTEAFNTLFQQNLLLVLHSPPFCNYFANSGLNITKVRTTPTFADVFVYWKTSQIQKTNDLGKTLDVHSVDIRHEIVQLGDLGKIPKIIFVCHKSEDVPLPSAEQIQDILSYQLKQSEKLHHEEGAEVNISDCDSSADIKLFEKRADTLGFNHKSAMDKIMKSITNSDPTS